MIEHGQFVKKKWINNKVSRDYSYSSYIIMYIVYTAWKENVMKYKCTYRCKVEVLVEEHEGGGWMGERGRGVGKRKREY